VNGGTIYNDASGNIASAATWRPWAVELFINNIGTATNQQFMFGFADVGAAGAATTARGDFGVASFRNAAISSNGSISFDSTQPATVDVRFTLSLATATLTANRFYGFTQKI
jgi:polyisoprenoid-binding protein YceI